MTAKPPNPTATEPGAGLRERTKLRRADRIIDAALELLRDETAPALTVDRIAEHAEVSKMTVFNLVGNRDQLWSALADRVLDQVDLASMPTEDPHVRARAIVDGYMRVMCADAPVFRALFAGWSESGRVLEHDPTDDLVVCMERAVDSGEAMPNLDYRRICELIGSGMIGMAHQWAAGLMTDRALRSRARDLVDLAFAAVRPSSADATPDWKLARTTTRRGG